LARRAQIANQYGQQKVIKQGEDKVPISKPSVKSFDTKEQDEVANLPDNIQARA
jgi:hypothetical protein